MLATLLELSSVAAKSFTFGEAQAAQAPAATELTGVEVGRNADGVTVTLKGNGKLAYGTLQEADRPPLRLVVDFPGVRPNVPPATPGQGALRRVRVALNNPNPLVTRVVLDLDVKVTYSVKASPDGREVTVVLAGPSSEQTRGRTARRAPTCRSGRSGPGVRARRGGNRLTGVRGRERARGRDPDAARQRQAAGRPRSKRPRTRRRAGADVPGVRRRRRR
jgi:hypothetical protein